MYLSFQQIFLPFLIFHTFSLQQAASALSQMEPPSLHETSKKQEAAKNIEDATKPLRKSIIKNGLHKHGDKEVRLLVSICVSEVFRILAPEPPFEDKYLRVEYIYMLTSGCSSHYLFSHTY